MVHNSKFIQDFMKYYDYPAEAVKTFTDVLKKLDDDKNFAKKFDKIVDDFNGRRKSYRELLPKIEFLSVFHGVNKFTLDFVFLLCLCENLLNDYKLAGLSEQLFYDTMADLKYKLLECIECKGVPGTFVAFWFDGFFYLRRFCFGRFQFELSTYNGEEKTLKSGRKLKKGDRFIGFHIPSSGVPLTDDVRMDSYKKAYEHFKVFFDDGNVLFGCGSWLLFPKHKEFLPKEMNILKFMNDFEIVNSRETKDFHDKWRVFGKDAKLPVSKLPRDTKLKKAYAEWLEKGNKTGDAFGVILFDGENII